MNYMTPEARTKVERIEGAHTIDDPGRQVVVRQIGDVRVTLDMPEGMGVPTIALYLYRSLPSGGRLAALEALGMNDEEHLRNLKGSEMYWYTREDDGIEATVWFDRPPRPAS